VEELFDGWGKEEGRWCWTITINDKWTHSQLLLLEVSLIMFVLPFHIILRIETSGCPIFYKIYIPWLHANMSINLNKMLFVNKVDTMNGH